MDEQLLTGLERRNVHVRRRSAVHDVPAKGTLGAQHHEQLLVEDARHRIDVADHRDLLVREAVLGARAIADEQLDHLVRFHRVPATTDFIARDFVARPVTGDGERADEQRGSSSHGETFARGGSATAGPPRGETRSAVVTGTWLAAGDERIRHSVASRQRGWIGILSAWAAVSDRVQMSLRPVPENIADTLLALARTAGEQIERALPEVRTVQYKKEQRATPTDPVSEVDHELERFLRREIQQRFPDHSIIGEELGVDDKGGPFTWVLDPIDGTTNFVNGFPLFASSIGVLDRGRPMAGAVWASTSHALRPGVYHVGADGELRFDGVVLTRREVDPSNRRFLSGDAGTVARHPGWDHRWTGSAAIECSMVAAGILHSSRLQGTHIWDVAGGLALVEAAGGHLRARRNGGWQRFESFADGDTSATALLDWGEDLLIGAGPTLERWIAASEAHG